MYVCNTLPMTHLINEPQLRVFAQIICLETNLEAPLGLSLFLSLLPLLCLYELMLSSIFLSIIIAIEYKFQFIINFGTFLTFFIVVQV